MNKASPRPPATPAAATVALSAPSITAGASCGAEITPLKPLINAADRQNTTLPNSSAPVP